jgi:hypothetical protein
MVHKAAHQGLLQLMPVVLALVVQPARPLVPPPPHQPLSARGALPLSARHFPPVSPPPVILPPPVMLPPLPAPPRCSLLTGPCAAVVWAAPSDFAAAALASAVRAELGRLRPLRPAAARSACPPPAPKRARSAARSACPPPAPKRARSTSRSRSRCCASTGGHARHSTRACDQGPRLRTWAPRHAIARSGRYECTR